MPTSHPCNYLQSLCSLLFCYLFLRKPVPEKPKQNNPDHGQKRQPGILLLAQHLILGNRAPILTPSFVTRWMILAKR